MEGDETTEQDHDELEMLLGEIPNATSVNHQSEDLGSTNPSPAMDPISQEQKEGKSSLSSPFSNLYHSPQAAKLGGDMAFYSSLNSANSPFDHKVQSNENLDDEKSDYRPANQDESNLPDDQSFSSAFVSGVPFPDLESPSSTFENSNNAGIRSLTGSPIQPYFEMPISHHIEQTNQDPYWNNSAVLRGLNQLDLGLMVNGACFHYNQRFCGKGESCAFAHGQKQTAASGLTYSGNDFKGVPGLNKVGKQIFPEILLTRSQELNSLRTLKSGSMTSNESPNHANYDKTALSNSHFHPPVLSTTPFQLDGRYSEGSYPDHSYFRLTSRSPQHKYNSVNEVVGIIHFMAKDQHGCRLLQRKFTEGTSEDVAKIFVEIIGHIVELMTDPFGNYLVQKLLEVCNEHQRMHIICEITRREGELIRISCDMYGTRVVQKVIESLKNLEEFSMIVSSLEPGIVPLMKDTNGNHVAQCCLQYLLPEFNEFLFDAATVHCVELARDRQGCCVLQNCLSHSDGERKYRLMSEIASNALVLSQDPFGNYVVQYILYQKVPWATEDVLEQLVGHFGYLSMQKYSSNVVEKCLKFGRDDRRVGIIKEIISNPRLVQILQDPYGNYVVQSAVKLCKGDVHTAIVAAIRRHIPALRNSPYGKKVLSSIGLKKK